MITHDQIIAFMQSDSVVYSCLPDSSKDSEKSVSSGVRPGSSRGLVLKHGHGSVLELLSALASFLQERRYLLAPSY